MSYSVGDFELLRRWYEQKYKVETSGVGCVIFRKRGEESRMEVLLNARGRAIIMKDQRTEEEIADEVSPSIWSYRPKYIGEEDPNRDKETFIQEALSHQEEYLEK